MFLVEGNKTIRELNNSKYEVEEIYSVNPDECDFYDRSKISSVNESELRKISQLQHPKDSVAVCKIPSGEPSEPADRIIVLDGIQDPGNFGTIIRLADWFGVEQIVCSKDTVDFYNPKVIQATMGSFTRVEIINEILTDYLATCDIPAIGADMDGKSIYQFTFPKRWALVMGNEGNGLRVETEALLKEKISIPRFGKTKSTESLNVSMATGIILGEIFSRQ